MTKAEARLVGCSQKVIPADCRQVIEVTKGRFNARSLTQCFTADDGDKYFLPMPAGCIAKAPADINCDSDGSLLHSRGAAWKNPGDRLLVAWQKGEAEQRRNYSFELVSEG